MKYSFIYILIIMFCCLKAVSQQTEINEPDSQLIVFIEITKSNATGSGFIVGSYLDTVYIVTASHVVETRDPEDPKDLVVKVNNQACQGIVALEHEFVNNKANDIALVKAHVPGFNARLSLALKDPSRTEGFFYIKATPEKPRVPQKRNGIFKYWDDENMLAFWIYLNEVTSGDSGSALFYKDQLAGMIIEDVGGDAVIINIQHIQKVLNPHLPNDCKIKFSNN